MSSQNNIYVDVIADVKGFNNLKKGEDSVAKLQHAFEKLGKTLGIGFGAAELVKFGKDAVQAFAADDQAAKILSNTLSNLGLAFTDVHVEDFITKLSETSGVIKNDLRTAFDSLVRATHDTNKAQDLLNLSLDVSKGTGKDLATVSAALAKAYGGNITSLSKLGTGLTKATLISGNFASVQSKLTAMFKGDAATAANSYQGKIDRLKTTFEEFKITIGKGLVDAFSLATAKGGGVDSFVNGMNSVSKDVADSVRGVGVLLGYLDQANTKLTKNTGIDFFGAIKTFLGFAFGTAELSNIGQKADAQSKLNALKGTTPLVPYKEGLSTAADHQKYIQAQKDAAQILKDQNAANAAKAIQVRLEKDALALKRASSIFDLNKIQIQAALISGATTLSKGDIARLQLKKDEADLQDAIDAKNADAADKLAAKITNTNTAVLAVSNSIASIPKAADPFTAVVSGAQNSIEWIKQLQIQVDALNASQSSSIYNPNPYAVPGYVPATSTAAPTVNVQVTLDGQVVGNAVTNTITNNQVDNGFSGVPQYINRNYSTSLLAW